jgi:PmbA protein
MAGQKKPAVNPSDLLLLGRRALGALKLPPGWQAELYLERSRFRDVGWAEKRPKDVRSGWSQGAALRVLSQGRQGFAFSGDVSPEAIGRLWDAASSAAALMPEEPGRALPPPRPAVRSKPAAQKGFFADSVKDLEARLARCEKKILTFDRRIKKALNLFLRESWTEWAVVNTLGVAARHASGRVTFDAEVLGETAGETQTAWASAQKPDWKNLDAEEVALQAAERAASSFGARPIASGAWPVVFDPWVGVEILDLAAKALCADKVQRGRSFFARKMGQPVASRLVTLMDDPLLAGGLASAPWDEEGVPSRAVALVKNGVLQDYLYDGFSAARDGRPAGGNAGREGPSSPPAPSPSNFHMAPGPYTRERLLAETPRGFWVKDVLGMHTADAVSGDFSVGASGLLLEKGRPARAVKGVTLAGNAGDLLKKVDAAADDLTWHGATGAPTFRVSALSVGGI